MPRSIATPMAGTWEQAMPATILATGLLLFTLVLVAVALGAAAARQHHLRIGLLGTPDIMPATS